VFTDFLRKIRTYAITSLAEGRLPETFGGSGASHQNEKSTSDRRRKSGAPKAGDSIELTCPTLARLGRHGTPPTERSHANRTACSHKAARNLRHHGVACRLDRAADAASPRPGARAFL